ncbi:MAG: DUF1080 domain-containing protein [Planctomycetota bacterium]|nr:DUF1080 domain-containing protein [Planctomycetota bacterium]MDA1177423.1 DUF1080 domain-containing protein [Planctomycetota bacterium]
MRRRAIRLVLVQILIFGIAIGLPCVTMAGGQTPGLAPDEIADGWISLFDGETLFGWVPAAKANWKVEDQTITVSSGEVGLLRTTAQFDDYVLRLEFRADSDTNSGVFFRTSSRPTAPGVDCYELNIAPAANPFPTGSLVGQVRYDQAASDDQWHTLEVTAKGEKVTIHVDGKISAEYSGPGPTGRGYIGLQHNQGRVAFRHIRLKPLEVPPLFNGKDLTGWKSYPDLPSKFTPTPAGELQVLGGRGLLESEQQFGDFVFQCACHVNGDRLNSGIFFRCQSGEQMNGYESQIHNGFLEGDRAKPQDCGTGGIFRRQNARMVVANDHEWFHKTIVVTGPRISIWVNGFLVTDWVDTRKPDPNPRRGLRTEPGTLMIQGHDPTTNLLFKDILVRELVVRKHEPT